MKTKAIRKMTAVLAVIMLLSFSFAGCSSGASAGGEEMLDRVIAAGELKVTMNTGNEPWTYQDGDSYDGFAIALVQGYCDAIGIKLTVNPMKFESMIPAVNEGQVDMICTNLSRTVPRTANVMFTDSIAVDYGVAVIKKGAFSKLSDLNESGVTLTTEAGTVHEEVGASTFPNAEMKTVDTTPNALQAVKSGRADAFLTNLQIAKEMVEKDGTIEIMEENVFTDPMAFAVDSSYLSSSFLNSFNVYLENIKADGTYKALWKKYLGTEWYPNADQVSL